MYPSGQPVCVSRRIHSALGEVMQQLHRRLYDMRTVVRIGAVFTGACCAVGTLLLVAFGTDQTRHGSPVQWLLCGVCVICSLVILRVAAKWRSITLAVLSTVVLLGLAVFFGTEAASIGRLFMVLGALGAFVMATAATLLFGSRENSAARRPEAQL